MENGPKFKNDQTTKMDYKMEMGQNNNWAKHRTRLTNMISDAVLYWPYMIMNKKTKHSQQISNKRARHDLWKYFIWREIAKKNYFNQLSWQYG